MSNRYCRYYKILWGFCHFRPTESLYTGKRIFDFARTKWVRENNTAENFRWF